MKLTKEKIKEMRQFIRTTYEQLQQLDRKAWEMHFIIPEALAVSHTDLLEGLGQAYGAAEEMYRISEQDETFNSKDADSDNVSD
jgi:small ligand-binding sensory domain FIST